MTSREALEKAWNLVHDKYPENNEEIQLVRYAIKTAMELNERDTPVKPKKLNNTTFIYWCPKCGCSSIQRYDKFCHNCGQKLDWDVEK